MGWNPICFGCKNLEERMIHGHGEYRHFCENVECAVHPRQERKHKWFFVPKEEKKISVDISNATTLT